MRIGVDASCWQNSRGYGRHARGLLPALVRSDPETRFTFFFDSQPAGTLPAGVEVRVVQAETPAAVAASANGRRSLRQMWEMGRAMSAPGFDALIFPTIYSYVPTWTRAKKVVMIHDVIAETYPRLTTPGLTSRLFWKIKTALGRWQADALVTVSEFSRRAIEKHFGSRKPVYVVGEASDPVFRLLPQARCTPLLGSRGVDDSRRLITYVGGFGPHKNLETLVTVFAGLKASGNSTLVMVGEYEREVFHTAYASIRELVESLGIQDRVVFTGYLPDEELVVLLNLSTVLVLPSLMEGFGLPALEAAACGCPVIATKNSPLPEVLGEGGIFVSPDAASLRSALETVLAGEATRRHMRDAGIRAAASHSWESAAQQMKSILHKVVRS